jgi:phage baseplate assembly protein W
MNATTGKRMEGTDHLKQSVKDVIGTRLVTRCMRRQYGCQAPALVDAPMNEATKLELFGAAAEALDKWEPRFKLDSLRVVEATADGRMVIDLHGMNLIDGQLISIEGIVL